MTDSRARAVHGVIALVVVAALVLRLVLVLDGASVLAEEEVPPLIPLLRPLLHLDGASWVADKLLHMGLPVIAIVGWLVAGPRPRAPWRDALLALVWPVAWLVWTLVVGAVTGWDPDPFLDPSTEGAGSVAATCLGVTVLFLALAAVLSRLDERMPPAPVRGAAAAPAPTRTTAQ